jgi:hypothetical protein
MHRLAIHKLPQLVKTDMEAASSPATAARGLAFGKNSSGQTAFLDVKAGQVGSIDHKTGERSRVVTIRCHQDPLTPGLLALDDAGNNVLVMASQSLHADAALLQVNLETQKVDTVHQLQGPGWLAGAFMPEGIVILEQKLGEEPVFSVIQNGQTLWTCAGAQSPILPAAWSNEVYLFLLCPEPNPLTGTGPTQLCALDIVQGVLAPLVPAQGNHIRVDGELVTVEGGHQILRAHLKSDGKSDEA